MRIGIIRSDTGFTLAEMLVVIVLLGVILAAAYMLMGTATGIANQIEAQTVAAEEGRVVLDQLSRELRQAYEINENEGAFLVAQPREVVFYTDVERDGRPDKVRYRVVEDKIYRSQSSATTDMPPYTFTAFTADAPVQGVLESTWGESVFTFYTNTNPPVQAVAPADISAVKIRLKNVVIRGQKSASVDVTTLVKVRSVHNTID